MISLQIYFLVSVIASCSASILPILEHLYSLNIQIFFIQHGSYFIWYQSLKKPSVLDLSREWQDGFQDGAILMTFEGNLEYVHFWSYFLA